MAKPLIVVCPRCGYTNDASRANCANCGSSLTPAAAAPASPPISRPSVGASRKPLKYLAIAAAIIAFFGVLGAPTDLVCQRQQAGAPVNCVQTTRLLWFIPMSPRQINDVRGARVTVGGGDYGGPGYRVELLTTGGVVPLMNGYTSGQSAKEQVARELNSLVQSAGPGKISTTEPGLLSAENLLCMVAWLVIWGVGTLLWSTFTSFTKSRNLPDDKLP